MFHDLKLEVQIDAEKVRNKTEDITRGTVQKSVCVLSRLPLYGQIQVVFFPSYRIEWQLIYLKVKMSLITQAYFEEGDFSNVSLIKVSRIHVMLGFRHGNNTPPVFRSGNV